MYLKDLLIKTVIRLFQQKSQRKEKNIYELLRASCQCDQRLFVLAYFIAANDANNEADIKNNRKYFLRKGEIQNYNVVIDGIDFYDQPR